MKKHGFGVLHIHDLGNTLHNKDRAFGERCRVFEVCNPAQAVKVPVSDMRLNTALPCRISIFAQKGKTMIGLIKSVEMQAALSQDPMLLQVAKEVEESTIRMVEEAK